MCFFSRHTRISESRFRRSASKLGAAVGFRPRVSSALDQTGSSHNIDVSYI